MLYPWDGRLNWASPRGKDEYIVAFIILRVAFQVLYMDGFCFTIDPYNFALDTSFHVQRFHELVRGHDKQPGAFSYYITGVIGKTTVRVTDVFTTFKHDDLGLLVPSSESGGSTCPSCDSSDDKVFLLHSVS